MKKNIIFVTLCALLTGCVNSKKFAGFIHEKVKDDKTARSSSDLVTFDFSALPKFDTTVISTDLNHQLIPAVLYWQWNYTIKNEINPQIAGNIFQARFLHHADSLGLLKKLGSQKLTIKVDSIPFAFTYTDRGKYILTFYTYLEAMIPHQNNFVMKYDLTQNGAPVKSGALKYLTADKMLKNKARPPKKFTWLYLDLYKRNLNIMAKDLVIQLLKEV